MKKILNYYAAFLPHLGGIEQNIYYFAKYSKMKHLVLTDKLPNTSNFEIIDNIEVYRAPPVTPPTTKSKLRLLSHLIREFPRELSKYQLLKKIDYDILHLRGPYLSADFFYGLDCLLGISFFKNIVPWRSIKKPKISTFHLLLSQTKFVSKAAEKTFWNFREKSSWLGFEKFLCKVSDEIICVDHYMIKPLEELAGDKKIHYIPSGIDLGIFKPMNRNEALEALPQQFQKSLKDGFNVLFLGRLDPMKGLPFLEQLADKLHNSIKIVVVGSGKSNIRSSKIVNLGKLDNNLIPYLLNSIDVTFQPVILEGISRVSIESLACGKPTIMLGSHMDRFPLENGKNGFIVDNIEQTVEIILDLYKSDPLFKKISENASATAKKFDVQKLAQQLDNVYQSVSNA